MKFEPLYFADRLTVVNPYGVIGVVTLWSKPEYVLARFREAGVDLDPDTSPIAVFGTLYGNGLRELLRNLLYNPQIQVLLICGHDRSGSQQELLNFFDLSGGIELIEDAPIHFLAERGLVTNPFRIKGTHRLIDGLVAPDLFLTRNLELKVVGDPKEEATPEKIRKIFAEWQPVSEKNPVRPASDKVPPLPTIETEYFPSNPRGHQIVQEGPLEAWLELVFVLARFGRRVTLKKGERLELQNVKVVVEKPKKDEPDRLAAHNLDPDKLDKYYREFLKGELRPDETYNYGHRLRKYFGIDALEVLAARLRKDPGDRKSYFTLMA